MKGSLRCSESNSISCSGELITSEILAESKIQLKARIAK